MGTQLNQLLYHNLLKMDLHALIALIEMCVSTPVLVQEVQDRVDLFIDYSVNNKGQGEAFFRRPSEHVH